MKRGNAYLRSKTGTARRLDKSCQVQPESTAESTWAAAHRFRKVNIHRSPRHTDTIRLLHVKKRRACPAPETDRQISPSKDFRYRKSFEGDICLSVSGAGHALRFFTCSSRIVSVCRGDRWIFTFRNLCAAAHVDSAVLSGCTWQLLSKRRAVPVFERR